jgi:hypothetical protein
MGEVGTSVAVANKALQQKQIKRYSSTNKAKLK